MKPAWEAAFDDLVRSASPGLLRTAVLLTGDVGAGEDLLQMTWMRVARRFTAADPRPTAYARQVLVNLSKDRIRSRSRRPRELGSEMPDVAGAGDPADQVPLRTELMAALRRLPERQRAVLVLRYFDDLCVDDVAEAMNCSPGTVKSQSHKALNALRALLQTHEEDHRYARR